MTGFCVRLSVFLDLHGRSSQAVEHKSNQRVQCKSLNHSVTFTSNGRFADLLTKRPTACLYSFPSLHSLLLVSPSAPSWKPAPPDAEQLAIEDSEVLVGKSPLL